MEQSPDWAARASRALKCAGRAVDITGTAPSPADLRMSHSSVSTYPSPPVALPRAGFPLCTPGLRLMRQLDLRGKLLVLLLGTWLPLLLALLLWNQPMRLSALDPLHTLLDGRLGTQWGPRWAPLSLLALALLASLYLAACLRSSLSEGLELLRRGAQDMASGRPHGLAQGFGVDELGQALQALGAAGDQLERLRGAAQQQAGALARAHAALRLDNVEVRAAVGEIARRTVALCGMLDADSQDAERASADLDAIHDEERHALQLMAALRTRLLTLARHCHALREAAGEAVVSQLGELDGPALELGEAVGNEIAHCHQLSERVGGAERLNERRIESTRLGTDRLVCRTERGMREGQQLMVLTRQIQAAQAAAEAQLEQLAAGCAALAALGEAPPAAPPT